MRTIRPLKRQEVGILTTACCRNVSERVCISVNLQRAQQLFWYTACASLTQHLPQNHVDITCCADSRVEFYNMKRYLNTLSSYFVKFSGLNVTVFTHFWPAKCFVFMSDCITVGVTCVLNVFLWNSCSLKWKLCFSEMSLPLYPVDAALSSIWIKEGGSGFFYFWPAPAQISLNLVLLFYTDN